MNSQKVNVYLSIGILIKFKSLSIEKRLNVVGKLFSFCETFIECGYVAVVFYDSSIIYNFINDEVTFVI